MTGMGEWWMRNSDVLPSNNLPHGTLIFHSQNTASNRVQQIKNIENNSGLRKNMERLQECLCTWKWWKGHESQQR
jgi:hypothetical protein